MVGSGSSALAGPDGARFAYPAQLEQALKERLPGVEIKVTAHVPSRQTTADMAAAMPKILADDHPALVIWQAGTVDALRGVEPEDFRNSLDQGLDAIAAAGADVVMMNMQYSPRTESMLSVAPFGDVMHWVAEQRGRTADGGQPSELAPEPHEPHLDRNAVPTAWSAAPGWSGGSR